MDQASDEMRQQRVAQIRSGRAADELLIEAIFGDILVGRLARREDSDALPTDPALAPVATSALSKTI